MDGEVGISRINQFLRDGHLFTISTICILCECHLEVEERVDFTIIALEPIFRLSPRHAHGVCYRVDGDGACACLGNVSIRRTAS